MDSSYRFPVNVVDSCPLRKTSWESRSSILNCSDDLSYTNRYFCLPNSKLTSLVEFCYDTIRPMVQKGYCIVLSGTGTIDYWKCRNFIDGCPPDYYFSDTVYKYPKCLDVNRRKSCFTAIPGCNETHTFIDANSSILQNTTQTSDTGHSGNYASVAIAVVITLLIVISLISAIYYMYTRRRLPWCLTKGQQSTRIDNPEEVEFLPKKDTDKDKSTDEEDESKISEREEVGRFSPEDAVKKLLEICDTLEKFLGLPEFDDDLQNELTVACPDYINVLQRKKADLLRKDPCIIIAGERNAGKTTLINKIVGSNVFVASNIAVTGRICRIRNSNSFGIKTYTKAQALKKEESAGNVKELKSLIEKTTDISNLTEEEYFVDVYLPVPILKGNVIIVDTPGIGESNELDNILLDFLPNAVSFVFVINASNAGGIQQRTLLKFSECVVKNKDDMPCFDPKETLFLTNKWDAIKEDKDDDDDDDEKSEKEKTWDIIKEKLKKGWQWITDDNVFRVCLIEVGTRVKNEYSEEYERFLNTLRNTVEHNKDRRVKHHFRFLEEFTRNAERGTHARLQLLQRSSEEQKQSAQRVQETIQKLKIDCKQKRQELMTVKNEVVRQLADKLFAYVHSNSGKDQILNPPGKTKISVISYWKISAEISDRFQQGIKVWCKNEEATSIIKDAELKIQRKVEEIETKLQTIQIEMSGIATNVHSSFFGVEELRVLYQNIVIFLPLVIVLAFFAPILTPLVLAWGWVVGAKGHRQKVDEYYYKCLAQVTTSGLETSFEHSFGEEYNSIIVRIFDDTLPRRIENFEKINQTLFQKQISIRQKHQAFTSLNDKIKQHERKIHEFKVAMKLNTN